MGDHAVYHRLSDTSMLFILRDVALLAARTPIRHRSDRLLGVSLLVSTVLPKDEWVTTSPTIHAVGRGELRAQTMCHVARRGAAQRVRWPHK